MEEEKGKRGEVAPTKGNHHTAVPESGIRERQNGTHMTHPSYTDIYNLLSLSFSHLCTWGCVTINVPQGFNQLMETTSCCRRRREEIFIYCVGSMEQEGIISSKKGFTQVSTMFPSSQLV
ncbi:hypothetical protein PIB30_017500 [Stylosanthes scabra]|uniref:Uncharacterized protein n=1 Tax=Stylosanthes scabra TaxID=79078 RepID=A0ABU6Q7L7_9FABA|nr:hypothetical protein [Stylosanthes scabra]